MARIQRIMKTFRENTPKELGGYKVVMAKDYQTQVFRNLETGEESGRPSAGFGCTALYTGGWNMGMYPPFRYRAEAEILHRREGGWSAGGTG